VKAYKVIQLGNSKCKLVGYFETWDVLHTALDMRPVWQKTLLLKWKHQSTPNLKNSSNASSKKLASMNTQSKVIKKVREFLAKGHTTHAKIQSKDKIKILSEITKLLEGLLK
jgi:hypothetical protein